MNINGPGESSLLLLKVIKKLNQHNIPYAIIGAFAASFYGQVRASLDADALISVEGRKENLDQLLISLKKGGFKVALRHGDSQDPIRSVVNIEDKFQNRVDLLTGIRGVAEDVFKRVLKASFMGSRVTMIGIEDFIAMKIFAGSPKDIHDVIGVLKVSAKKIDLKLLRQLALRFGKIERDKLEKILNEGRKK